MNSYNNMKLHLTGHVYMRGRNKGDAPVAQRAKTHFRVVEGQQEMYVRFHNANIITAYPDGSFMLDCRGWADSATTKAAVSEAAWKFCRLNINIHTRLVMSVKQLCVRVAGKTYVYYDGITFDVNGNLLTEARPFQMRRINRGKTKQYALDIQASGFKDMFPILYATCTPEQSREWLRSNTDEITTRDYEAAKWPILIAKHKYYGRVGSPYRKDMKATWASIMKDAKVYMYDVDASSLTVL
jgi:hypothetical protein